MFNIKKVERQKFKKYLNDLKKIDNPKQIEFFDDITSNLEQTFSSMYNAEYLFESRIKKKDKFNIKYIKSLATRNANSSADIFEIRITMGTKNTNYVALALLHLGLIGIIPPDDFAQAKKNDKKPPIQLKKFSFKKIAILRK